MFLSPITQSESYHDFADKRIRTVLGVPIENFNDVVSNLQFVMTALVLMIWHGATPEPYSVFLRALLLVGPCSAFYHLSPTSRTLVVDRMAMSAAFGAVLCHAHLPEFMLWPSILVSLGTVAYWHTSGDLRPYILLQYGGCLSLTVTRCWPILPLYVLAKIVEKLDRRIFELTGGRISGHTLKHVFAGLAPLFLPVE